MNSLHAQLEKMTRIAVQEGKQRQRELRKAHRETSRRLTWFVKVQRRNLRCFATQRALFDSETLIRICKRWRRYAGPQISVPRSLRGLLGRHVGVKGWKLNLEPSWNDWSATNWWMTSGDWRAALMSTRAAALAC